MLADCQDSVLFHSRNRSIRWVRMVALPTINTVLVGEDKDFVRHSHFFSATPPSLAGCPPRCLGQRAGYGSKSVWSARELLQQSSGECRHCSRCSSCTTVALTMTVIVDLAPKRTSGGTVKSPKTIKTVHSFQDENYTATWSYLGLPGALRLTCTGSWAWSPPRGS